MNRTVKLIGILVALLSTNTILYAEEDNIDADEAFVQRNNTVNESFIRSIARNRVHQGSPDAVFVEIDGMDEFRESIESGELNAEIREGNGINRQYIYRDIQNVRVDDRDLRNMEGEMINLGSQIKSDNQQVTQVLNISNSDIRSDLHQINAGIVIEEPDIDVDRSDVSGIVNRTNIKNSILQGTNRSEIEQEIRGDE